MRLVLVLFFLLAAGCNYSRSKVGTDKNGPGAGPKAADVGPVDFATVKSVVIGPKCIGCHAGFDSYTTVKSMVSRIQFRALEKKDMPPSGLSGSEFNVLLAWIDQGSLETVVEGPATKPDPGLENDPVTFGLVKEKIFQAHCLSCHSGTKPDAGVDLSDLPTARFKADRIFKRIFVTQDMPIPPMPSLNPVERRILLKWFDLGMPQ